MLALAAAAFSLALAVAGSCQKKRSLSTWCFAVGRLVFALENLFGAMWREAVVAERAAFWGSLTLVMKSSIWYLNNNVLAGGGFGPTLPPGWGLVGVADFNRDGHADYALFNPITRQTAIWYLNNNVYAGSAWGPTLPVGWSLVAP
jgi:hypothetical protein